MPAAREWITAPPGDHLERAARDAWADLPPDWAWWIPRGRVPWRPSPLVFALACAVGFVIGWWVASMGPAL